MVLSDEEKKRKRSEYDRKRHILNSKKNIEKAKKRYIKNREEISAQAKKRYIKNREKILSEKRRKYVKKEKKSKPLPNKSELERLYLKEIKTMTEIAKIYHTGYTTIRKLFVQYRIKIGTIKGKKNIGTKMSAQARKSMSISQQKRISRPGYIPPRLGKKHSKKSRKKMSSSMKGRTSSFKGKHHSEEAKKKLSESRKGSKNPMFGKPGVMLGRIHTKKTKKKMSVSQKKKYDDGFVPYWQGKKNPAVSKRLKGIPSPFRGKKYSKKEVEEMARKRRDTVALKYPGGLKHSAESKKRMRVAAQKRISRPGYVPPMLGKKHPKKTRQKMSEIHSRPERIQQQREIRAKQKFPFKDSKPELVVQSILNKNGINFKKHKSFKLSKSYHQADIVVEPNYVIEVFGDYWHFNPKMYDGESIQRKRRKQIKAKDVWKYDKYVIDEMKQQGYKVLVVWESELKNELDRITKKILKFIDGTKRQI